MEVIMTRTTDKTPDKVKQQMPSVTDANKQQMQRYADKLVAEVMNTGDDWDEETLRNITSFDDAVRLVEETHGPIVSADEELGDGFTLLSTEDKDLLIGLPMLLMAWRFNDGDAGRFVSIRVLVQNRDKSVSRYIFNDGSTGICEQLAKFQLRTGRAGGLKVQNGLRRSDYLYEDPTTGEQRPASTYYLDTSA
jgi:hypothetical protein